MTDKDLLIAAAKAAGIDARRLPDAWPERFDDDQWNPLIDDGDALRLAAKLNINIKFFGCGGDNHQGSWRVFAIPQIPEHTWRGWELVFLNPPFGYSEEFRRVDEKPFHEFDKRTTDKMAACRRAIVRAAAALGDAA